MALVAVKRNGRALKFASDELRKGLPVYLKASLRAHRDFAFVLHGARRQRAPAAEEPHTQELPLEILNHHGYYHGIVMKRLVADFAGVTSGHAFALRRDAAQNLLDAP